MRSVFAVDLLRSSDPPDRRRREVFERRRAKLLHGVAGLGAQDCKDALDAWLTESAESPEIGPADAHPLRAHRKGFDDVAAAAKAAGGQVRHGAADRPARFLQL